tara:strand:- start:62 stop:244 length:183 start_codon:yes stop_codon:yes gene_type:complete
MKTYKNFKEGIDDDLKGNIDAIGQAFRDEKANPIKGGGSKVNRLKGKKILDRLLGKPPQV